MTTLETRRKRGDLIQFYKSLNGLDRIEWMNELLKVDRGVNLRNGGVSFHREPANITTERDQFFINRVIPLWNNLPQTVKEARTLNSFKAGLDRLRSFST